MTALRLGKVFCAAILAALASESSAAGLDDTSWRLVKIMSMDDRVDEPAEPEKYTIEFKANGGAAITADCNRGSGSWRSDGMNQIAFGPIASTKALCPPGSLSETYLGQFEWVRSYVMKDGHLFLATMADGSIIEFEPVSATSAAATVFGEDIRTADAFEMQGEILARLFGRFAEENGIVAGPDEVASFLEAISGGRPAGGQEEEEELTPEEARQVEELRNQMAHSAVRQWKINKALYETFGGRIIYQQLGPEPLDAYRLFLEKRQSEGAFTIRDKTLEKDFWRYFTDDTIHDFMEPGGPDEARAFRIPPWQSQ